MAAAAENGGAPKTELQELQMKANQVTDEVSWPVYPVQSSSFYSSMPSTFSCLDTDDAAHSSL